MLKFYKSSNFLYIFLILFLFHCFIKVATNKPFNRARLINGEPTSIQKWPFLAEIWVLLDDEWDNWGMGSWVSQQHIITDIDCIYNNEEDKIFQIENLKISYDKAKYETVISKIWFVDEFVLMETMYAVTPTANVKPVKWATETPIPGKVGSQLSLYGTPTISLFSLRI